MVDPKREVWAENGCLAAGKLVSGRPRYHRGPKHYQPEENVLRIISGNSLPTLTSIWIFSELFPAKGKESIGFGPGKLRAPFLSKSLRKSIRL